MDASSILVPGLRKFFTRQKLSYVAEKQQDHWSVPHRSGTRKAVGKKRNRVKQTTSLTFRLGQLAEAARARASILPPGAERERMLRKAREAESAIAIEKLVTSPGTELPT
ncbi:hypothetical protein [Bradyrhizobium sp. USDA 4451]